MTDPHNLGAVIRSAEGAGASGVVITERNAARVTPAVCKASAGAVEHLPVAVVVNLGRYLEEIKGPQLWVWGRPTAAPRRPSGRPTWPRASHSCSARRDEACGPAFAAPATMPSPFRSPATSSR